MINRCKDEVMDAIRYAKKTERIRLVGLKMLKQICIPATSPLTQFFVEASVHDLINDMTWDHLGVESESMFFEDGCELARVLRLEIRKVVTMYTHAEIWQRK